MFALEEEYSGLSRFCGHLKWSSRDAIELSDSDMKVLALNSVEVLELHDIAVEAGAAHATAELVLFSS